MIIEVLLSDDTTELCAIGELDEIESGGTGAQFINCAGRSTIVEMTTDDLRRLAPMLMGKVKITLRVESVEEDEDNGESNGTHTA